MDLSNCFAYPSGAIKQYASTQNEVSRWSGIAFEMLGAIFCCTIGEISEVIYPPKYTPVPNTQAWVRGLANIRGDCFQFLI